MKYHAKKYLGLSLPSLWGVGARGLIAAGLVVLPIDSAIGQEANVIDFFGPAVLAPGQTIDADCPLRERTNWMQIDGDILVVGGGGDRGKLQKFELSIGETYLETLSKSNFAVSAGFRYAGFKASAEAAQIREASLKETSLVCSLRAVVSFQPRYVDLGRNNLRLNKRAQKLFDDAYELKESDPDGFRERITRFKLLVGTHYVRSVTPGRRIEVTYHFHNLSRAEKSEMRVHFSGEYKALTNGGSLSSTFENSLRSASNQGKLKISISGLGTQNLSEILRDPTDFDSCLEAIAKSIEQLRVEDVGVLRVSLADLFEFQLENRPFSHLDSTKANRFDDLASKRERELRRYAQLSHFLKSSDIYDLDFLGGESSVEETLRDSAEYLDSVAKAEEAVRQSVFAIPSMSELLQSSPPFWIDPPVKSLVRSLSSRHWKEPIHDKEHINGWAMMSFELDAPVRMDAITSARVGPFRDGKMEFGYDVSKELKSGIAKVSEPYWKPGNVFKNSSYPGYQNGENEALMARIALDTWALEVVVPASNGPVLYQTIWNVRTNTLVKHSKSRIE